MPGSRNQATPTPTVAAQGQVGPPAAATPDGPAQIVPAPTSDAPNTPAPGADSATPGSDAMEAPPTQPPPARPDVPRRPASGAPIADPASPARAAVPPGAVLRPHPALQPQVTVPTEPPQKDTAPPDGAIRTATDSAGPPPDRPPLRGPEGAMAEPAVGPPAAEVATPLPREGGVSRTGPPSAPVLPAATLQQAAIAVVHAPDGHVELTLDPEELGRLQMSLSSDETSILVTIQAERPESAELFRRHADQLAQEFRALGYRDVSFDFGGRGGGRPAPEPPPPADPAPELIAPQEPPTAPAQHEARLDIRL